MNWKRQMRQLLLRVIILSSLFGATVTVGAATNTKESVQKEITQLKKEISELNDLQKKTKKQKEDLIPILSAKKISNSPYIIAEDGLFSGTTYYWVNDSKNLDDLLVFVMGYVRTTGEYKTYNGYTCAVCNAVKVKDYSSSISKKEKKLKKLQNALNNTIQMKNSTVSIGIGKTETLSVKEKYSEDYNKITWKSSDDKIVTVTGSGKIKGIKSGTAEISATTSVSNKSAKCKITVGETAKSVTLNYEYIDLGIGESIELEAILEPSNVIDTVAWKSSNTKVATVSQNGLVEGRKSGYAEITVVTSGGKKTRCGVNVGKKITEITFPSESITISSEKKSYSIYYTTTPEYGSSQLKWTSSNEDVAKFNSYGFLDINAAGSTVITVTTLSNVSASFTLNVSDIASDNLYVAVAKILGDKYLQNGFKTSEDDSYYTVNDMDAVNEENRHSLYENDTYKVLDYFVEVPDDASMGEAVLWLKIDLSGYDYENDEENTNGHWTYICTSPVG